MPVFVKVPARIVTNDVRDNPVKVHQTAREVSSSLSDEVKDLLRGEAGWVLSALVTHATRPVKQLLSALYRVELAQLELVRVEATKAEVFSEWVQALDPELRSALETPLDLVKPNLKHRKCCISAFQALNQLARDFSRPTTTTTTKPRSARGTSKKPAKAS